VLLGHHPRRADGPAEQLGSVTGVGDLDAGQLNALAFAAVLDRQRPRVVDGDYAHHAAVGAHRHHEGENEGDQFHLRSCGAGGKAIARRRTRTRVWRRKDTQGGTPPAIRRPMPVRIRTSGCLFSIIASLLLTLLLNLALRACS
jgi:hypothetical protein